MNSQLWHSKRHKGFLKDCPNGLLTEQVSKTKVYSIWVRSLLFCIHSHIHMFTYSTFQLFTTYSFKQTATKCRWPKAIKLQKIFSLFFVFILIFGKPLGMKFLVCCLFLYPCRGYIRFGQEFVTQLRRHLRAFQVYRFWIGISETTFVRLSVCPSVLSQTSLSVLMI